MKNASEVVTKYLQYVNEEVSKLVNPSTGQPVGIPNYQELLEAAGKLDTTKYPENFISIILTLLGRAKSVGFDSPDTSYKVSFPNDHHLHLNMGDEWYWIACHANATDQNGDKCRLSSMIVMEKMRCVSKDFQNEAGWSDEEASIVSNLATVTIDRGPGNRSFHRRSENNQWSLKGGNFKCSSPGEKFSFECGDDKLSGTENVLPLNVKVDDGDNMKIDIKLTNRDTLNLETSFFLQGIPELSIGGSGGTGITPVPTPGIYYSWPQLLVSGTISAGGNTYTIDSGSGWIDHQLMMTSLKNPKDEASPVPFVDDYSPFNGWTWQFFNLENGDAFTGSSFILGEMQTELTFPYGYYMTPKNGKWKAHYITGKSSLLYPKSFPSIVCSKNSKGVTIPIVRTFTKLKSIFGEPLSGVATPWDDEGTFNGANLSVASEVPADFYDMSGHYSNGVGYLESVGFQNVNDYREFILEFLKNEKHPCKD